MTASIKLTHWLRAGGSLALLLAFVWVLGYAVRQRLTHHELTVQLVADSPLTDLMHPDWAQLDLSRSLREIQQQVLLLPWVKDASVRRVWPNQLLLKIEPHQPLAHWGEDQVLSTEGHLVPLPAGSEVHGLPWVQAPAATAPMRVVRRLMQLQQAFAEMAREQIATLTIATLVLEDSQEWQVWTVHRGGIFFGATDFDGRLKRLKMHLSREVFTSAQVVDLRHPVGVARRGR